MAKECVVRGDGFEVYFTWFGDYLFARVEGLHDSLDITLAYWKIISAECNRRQASRLLVLENLIEPSADLDVQEIFRRFMALGIDPGLKIAFVDRNETNWALQEQITLLALEHGITARIFTQQRDAVTWLRHGID